MKNSERKQPVTEKYDPTLGEFIRDLFGFGRLDLSFIFYFFVFFGDALCCLLKYFLHGSSADIMSLAIGYLIVPACLSAIGVILNVLYPVDRNYFLTKTIEKDFRLWIRPKN
jgi:hypothetical protein